MAMKPKIRLMLVDDHVEGRKDRAQQRHPRQRRRGEQGRAEQLPKQVAVDQAHR